MGNEHGRKLPIAVGGFMTEYDSNMFYRLFVSNRSLPTNQFVEILAHNKLSIAVGVS